MSVEGTPVFPRSNQTLPPKSTPKTTTHPTIKLATSTLTTHNMPPEGSTVRMHVRPMQTQTASQIAPLAEDANFEQIKQYLDNWVNEDPKTHKKETALEIMDFLDSLKTSNPNNQIIFEHTTCVLPDIFHTKLIADNLESLVIESPKIKTLPRLASLTNLINIELTGCAMLTALPEDLGILKKLTQLDLHGCTGLTQLPDTLSALDKLTITGLGDCRQLIALPQAMLNKSMGNKQTLLTQAVIEKNENAVRLLKRLGADFNQSSGNGHTPIMHALIEEDLAMIRLLASLGANIEQPSKGLTPLTSAIRLGDLDIIKVLVEELKANVNQSDGRGCTPLFYAISNNNAEMVKLLLENKADFQLKFDGFTPIEFAIVNNFADIVMLLIKFGVNLNEPCGGHSKETPLIFAVHANKPDVVKQLITMGANINLPGSDGDLPITHAMIIELPDMVHLLETLGADKQKAERKMKIKFLAHVWGIGGTYGDLDSIALEGLAAKYSMRMLEKYVTKFFTSQDFLLDPILLCSLSRIHRKNIQEAITQGFPLSSADSSAISDRVKSGKPVLILGGFVTHSISMVLYNDMLILFNRGAGKGGGDAVRSYQLPAAQLTPEIIEQLATNEYPNSKAFYNMINGLKLTRAKWGYDQKPQEVGNCTWASAKGAFGILCRLFTNDEVGRLTYKKFTTFVRKQTFDEFQLEYEHIDPELIHFVREKGIKKGILQTKKQNTEDKP